MSLARRHRQRMLAAAALSVTAAVPERSGAAASEYELMKATLGVDLRRLSEIQSVERKIELKRELLPKYRDWVAGALLGDTGAEDVIVTHVMIWLIDVGQFSDALDVADYVLRHKLPLPERFDRTAATLIVEEIAEGALKALGQEGPHDRDWFDGQLSVLMRVAAIAAEHDIFDQVRAKLEKAVGFAFEAAAGVTPPDSDGPAGLKASLLTTAREHLRRALELDATSGVKKRIEKIERELKALATPAPAPAS